jgi:actin-like ATPase involved in cell morphogenesis
VYDGGTVASQSIARRHEMDQAMIAFVKKEYSLMLGERAAEEIKMAIGSACPSPQEPPIEIRGRDLVSGLRKTAVVSGGEIRHAIAEPFSAVVEIVKTALDKCPRELRRRHGPRYRPGRWCALHRRLDERLGEKQGSRSTCLAIRWNRSCSARAVR